LVGALEVDISRLNQLVLSDPDGKYVSLLYLDDNQKSGMELKSIWQPEVISLGAR